MLEPLKEKLRTLGWADTAWFSIDAVLRRVSSGSAGLIKYYFVAQPVARRAATQTRASATMRLYVGAKVDDTISQAPRPAQTLRSRFEQRARCVVADRGGELAGFIWLCPGSYREDTVRCLYRWSPADAALWDFDVFIAPPYRMSRLFSRLWERAHALLAEEGIRWTLSRIDAFNPGSLAAHRKLGAVDIAHGWFLVLGRLQITVATVPPYWHLSLSDANPAQLRFDLSRLPGSDAQA